MRCTKLVVAGILAMGFSLACGEIVEPEPGAEVAARGPAFNYSNGPDVSGNVFRFSGDPGFFWTNVDEDRRLLVFLSPYNGILNFTLEECTEITAVSPEDALWVESPQSVVRLLVQNASAYAYVFDYPPDFPFPPCQYLLEHMIATGQVRFQYNDNDWFLTGSGTNTSLMQAQGDVDDLVNGGTTRLRMLGHWQWLQDGSFKWISSLVQLSPDPRTS